MQANPLTAALGIGNLLLYAAIYTPLKQVHPINTWVGAIVGAIPPLMGWAAATGSLDPGAWYLAAVLYLWQLPHFMALAWMCREDYARGGHRMISLLDTTGRRTAGVALRNALALVPLGFCAVNLGIAHTAFIYESVGLSLVFALSASAFYTRPTQQTARLLFRMSLFHLPVYLALLALHRAPNTQPVTWRELRARLTEQGLREQVHGDEYAPQPRGGSGDRGKVSVAARVPVMPMIFPFSPPMALPCPYSTIKRGVVGSAGCSQSVAAAAAVPCSEGPGGVASSGRRERNCGDASCVACAAAERGEAVAAGGVSCAGPRVGAPCIADAQAAIAADSGSSRRDEG